jgi:hypothetical protein
MQAKFTKPLKKSSALNSDGEGAWTAFASRGVLIHISALGHQVVSVGLGIWDSSIGHHMFKMKTGGLTLTKFWPVLQESRGTARTLPN